MVLYLGLDPGRYPHEVFHYPVIRTVVRENLDVSKAARATHFLFTSRSAVNYWVYPIRGEVLAVGEGTAAALREKGLKARVAPKETQEGMVELLETLDLSGGYVFWPRSLLARPVIEEYLIKRNVPFTFLDLYETKHQRPEPVPNLADFDEIVFTSPSTVAAFLEIFGSLPTNKKLTPIGPVTAEAVSNALSLQRSSSPLP